MHFHRHRFRSAILKARRTWLRHGILWAGAVGVGLVAVLYARLIDYGYDLFQRYVDHWWWLPLVVTPAISGVCVWITRMFFQGSEGSGIPQVIAVLDGRAGLGFRLLTLRILAGKILVSFIAITGGMTIGREGPTIHIGAALMFHLRRLYPKRILDIHGKKLEHRLVLAGAAAGLSAAFNAPLAGVVFAIEELTRSFEQRTSGVTITAIIVSGIVSLSLQGNYVYFGTINIGTHLPEALIAAVPLVGITTGIAGGIFCWLLLNPRRWMPPAVGELRAHRPVAFGVLCGLVIAIIGLLGGGHTFGSGYAEARAMLENREQLGAAYPLLKMVSMVGSYLPGAPGGLFAPSLAIGAGMGNALHMAFSQMPLSMLIALGMVGYLAAVTQSPITAFVIVIEMCDGHALVISIMATALVASRVSRFFAPPLYEALSERYKTHREDSRVPRSEPALVAERGN